MRLQGIQKALQPFLYIFVTETRKPLKLNCVCYKGGVQRSAVPIT